MNFERILTELRSEKSEWFGPSPIEPSNPGLRRVGQPANKKPRLAKLSEEPKGSNEFHHADKSEDREKSAIARFIDAGIVER